MCDYIMHGGDRAEFLAKFENAMSAGFDPEQDLQRIGMANQTTMLKVCVCVRAHVCACCFGGSSAWAEPPCLWSIRMCW